MKLTEKLESLVFMACKQAGSYHPDNLSFVEEQLTPSEYKTAVAFLTWVNEKPDERMFGRNIRKVFQEFLKCTK